MGTDRELTVPQIVSLSRSGAADAPRGFNIVICCQSLDYSEFAEDYSHGVRLVIPMTYNVPELEEQLRGKRGFEA